MGRNASFYSRMLRAQGNRVVLLGASEDADERV